MAVLPPDKLELVKCEHVREDDEDSDLAPVLIEPPLDRKRPRSEMEPAPPEVQLQATSTETPRKRAKRSESTTPRPKTAYRLFCDTWKVVFKKELIDIIRDPQSGFPRDMTLATFCKWKWETMLTGGDLGIEFQVENLTNLWLTDCNLESLWWQREI